MPDAPFSGVPVVPNASEVRGRIVEIRSHPDGGADWTVAVEDARDVQGLPDFVRDHVGGRISVFVGPEDGPALAPNDAFEARIAYRGDQHGGRFVAVGQVRKR